jgi:hypothetical protein
MFCLLSVFCVSLLTYNWIRINKEGGTFSWAQGHKIPTYGLATASHTIPCIFRCAVSIQQVRQNGKIRGARYT